MSTEILEPSAAEITPPGDILYEIVDGRVVEKTMGVYEVHVTNLIDFFLGRFAYDHKLGYVESEMLFHLVGDGRHRRRPDIAFISYDRWPRGKRFTSENSLKVVPDLVVEVVSPSNFANEVEEKVVEYLRAGVRLVWVVHTTTGRIYAHDGSPIVRVFDRTSEIDGGQVLPEFRLALAEVFEPEPESP